MKFINGWANGNVRPGAANGRYIVRSRKTKTGDIAKKILYGPNPLIGWLTC
jgi:hypothetical protein